MSDDGEVLRDTARRLFTGGPRGDRWAISTESGDVRRVEPPSPPVEPPPTPPEQRNVVPHEGRNDGRPEGLDDDLAQLLDTVFHPRRID